MNPRLTWLLAGAILGWLTSIVLRRTYSGQLFNIVVGMVAAFVTGSLLAPLFRVSTITPGIFNLPALLISLGGAATLLVVANYFSKENNIKENVIEHRWAQVSDKISARWGKITQEDIANIDGNYKQFIETIQVRYGITHREAENQIQRYLRAVLVGS